MVSMVTAVEEMRGVKADGSSGSASSPAESFEGLELGCLKVNAAHDNVIGFSGKEYELYQLSTVGAQAWSNGRVHAPLHKVAVGGREDWLSCGVFLLPSKDLIVDAPPELVTADAPRRFRPFAYMDYLRFKHDAGNGEDVLDRFAGM